MKYLMFLLLLFPTLCVAAEQRCTDLGSNCICSEPLNTSTLTKTGGFSYDPADSTTKECDGFDGVSGGAIVVNPITQLTTGNDSGVLGAFPANHSVSHYTRGVEGHVGAFWLGHQDSGLSSTFLGRTAFRWYVYHSSTTRGDTNDFHFKNEVDCENTKFAQSGPVWDLPSTPALHMSAGGLSSWTYNSGANTVGDCCIIGPPVDVGGVGAKTTGAPQSKSDWKGSWWRMEIAYSNRAGGSSPDGTVIEMWAKNVSTGADEVKVIDTTVEDSAVGPTNAWLGADDLTPNITPTAFQTNNYRQATCEGYRALSHYMLAGWDTDTGQRIGEASEIEGGGAAETSGVLLLIGP